MSTSAWLRFGLLLAAMGLFVAATTPAQGREPRAFGKRLVAQYQLPPDAIARYAAMAAGTAQKVVRREESMFADQLPWIGPRQRAGVGHNPYTLVFTVSGVAKATGEVFAHWQAGWEIQESPVASRELLMQVPQVARTGVAAGQAITLTAHSTRLSFRGERSVAPMLGLVQTRNLDINDVQVQVWSGDAPHAWPVLPWSRAALLALAVTCLLVAWRYRFWQPTVSEPDAIPVRNPLPLIVRLADPVALERIEATPAAAPIEPAPAAPSQQARVFAALHHVVTVGLTVPTVLDEKRMRRRRAAQ